MEALDDTGPVAPCPEPFNLAGYVLSAGRDRPDRIVLRILGVDRAERWSHARLEAAVRGVGAGLLAEGLAPGARVLMRLGNGPEFALVFLGAIAAGLVPVPTAAGLTARELDQMAAQVAPAAVVADPGLALPGEGGGWRIIDAARVADWARGAAGSVDYAQGAADRPAYILFTSGSSGRPRPVVHAHRAIWARRMMWRGWYGLGPDDRLLHAGAFNWSFTLGTGLLDPWAAGACALIPAPGVEPAQLPLLLRRHDATLFAAAPGVYRRMLRNTPLPALPQLRHGLSAGEAMPETLARAWTEATGTPVHQALGMTECSTFISGSPDRPAPAGAIGYAQPGRRVAVLGGEGQVLARGVPGVLAVSRDDPGLFLEYLGAPEETAQRFRGAWFVTGDWVSMAADGAIAYLGRDDDMMNAGGFRVSPLEVESAMAAHPAIVECAAAAVAVRPDVHVIACFYAGAEIDGEALAEFASTRLARYKQPRIFIRCPALPRGANGKILRRRLRDEYEARHDQA